MKYIFSSFKRVNKYLRNTMGDDRLNDHLMVKATEK